MPVIFQSQPIGALAVSAAPESRVAATAGPFPTGSTNLQSAFANDFGLGVTIITAFYVDARTGTQAISGTAGTTGGWVEQISNTVHALLLTGGTTITLAEGAARFGLNISSNCHLAAGSIRGSRNGVATALRSASPTYVAVTGAPSTTLGRAAGSTANACTAVRIAWQVRLERDATDAEQQAWAGTVNQLDRYRPPQSLIDAVNAQNLISGSSWIWDAQTDYDPAQATSVTGIGTGPTWTRNGTPAKTTFEPEIEKVINLADWHHNVLDLPMTAQVGTDTYRKGNPYREYKFTTNASHFTVKMIADWAGGFLASIGVRQDNTPLNPLTVDTNANFMWRRMDVVGLTGSHDYRVIDGMQSIVGGVNATYFDGAGMKGVTSALVQIPKSATFTVTAPSTHANVLVVTGDSFEGKNSAITPTTEAPLMVMRDLYPGSVIAFTWFACGHWNFADASGSAVINRFVGYLTTAFAGATSKRWLNNLSENDAGVFASFWSSRSQMRTQMAALFDAVHTADATTTIHLRTALLRTAVYEGSTVSDASVPGTGAGTTSGGTIYQDIRDDFGTVQSTRTAFMTLFNGKAIFPNFAPSVNHDAGDNYHPSPTGEALIASAGQTYLAAQTDSVGSGF